MKNELCKVESFPAGELVASQALICGSKPKPGREKVLTSKRQTALNFCRLMDLGVSCKPFFRRYSYIGSPEIIVYEITKFAGVSIMMHGYSIFRRLIL